jgi:hypothetical protein
MRYLMDIFATENEESQQGQFRKAYAFVAHGDGDAEHQRRLWEAKHVTPILYHNTNRHQLLTVTLESWAHIRRAGSDGRFQIFMDVVTKPFQGDVDHDNLANAAWALADRGHRTARRLGGLNPEESGSDADISWLGPLLGAQVIDPRDTRRHPTTCRLVDIDEVKLQLCQWAMRHLADRRLVNLAISAERLLLTHLRETFFTRLSIALHQSHKRKFTKEPYRLFWQMLVDAAATRDDIRGWDTYWQIRPGQRPTVDVLKAMLGWLQPRLRWPAQPFGIGVDQGEQPERLCDLARYEISDEVGLRDHTRFRDIFAVRRHNKPEPRNDLPSLTDDLTSLLLGLCRLGAKVDALFTQVGSRYLRESIAPDIRNQLELDDWEWLIEAVVQSFGKRCLQATGSA